MIGIVFVPICIVYVIVRNLKLMLKEIFIKLFRLRNDRSNRDRRESSAVNNYYIRRQARNFEKFVKEKKHKYYQQMTLLKFSEGIFEALPQITLQTIVYLKYSFVYDRDINQSYFLLFWISVICSALMIERCIYEATCHWSRLKTIFD